MYDLSWCDDQLASNIGELIELESSDVSLCLVEGELLVMVNGNQGTWNLLYAQSPRKIEVNGSEYYRKKEEWFFWIIRINK